MNTIKSEDFSIRNNKKIQKVTLIVILIETYICDSMRGFCIHKIVPSLGLIVFCALNLETLLYIPQSICYLHYCTLTYHHHEEI